MKKNQRNTRGRIVAAAWRLFYEQGYDATTVEEIIFESGTSKGSFYHYFDGKDALLSSLSYLFDDKYEKLQDELPDDMPAFKALLWLNRELFTMIDESVSMELMAHLLSSQLVTSGERHLLDRSRVYFRLIRRIVVRGQQRGELRTDLSAGEIVKSYALLERALMYDWCLCGGEYALSVYAARALPIYLDGFRAVPSVAVDGDNLTK